jgi:hypothetical protein
MKYKLYLPLSSENLLNKELVELEDLLLDLTKLKKSANEKTIGIIINNISIVNNFINNHNNKIKSK